jgi:hypothetical protein
VSKGLVGEPPEWYAIVRAAKYLGVAPWALLDQPYFWFEVALAAEDAEGKAADAEHKRASAKQPKKG